jgi:hypothetical protein
LSFVFIKFALKIYFITKKTNAYILDNSIHIRLTTSVVIATDCTGSCKSNYHTITIMTMPYMYTVVKYVGICLFGSPPVSSTNITDPRYNWNIVENCVKHHKAYINKMHCIKYCSYVLFKLSLDINCYCSFFFFCWN